MHAGTASHSGWGERLARGLAIAAFAGLVCGCSARQLLVNRVGDALAAGGDVYAADDDIELVGAATPFGLKLLESLLAESPRHRGLLLALARGFTQYAYAYVELPADVLEDRDVSAAYAARDRARRLYLRARDYGLRGLEVAHPGFDARHSGVPDAALATLGAHDVPLLYWTAAAWGAGIALGKDDPAVVGGLPAVRQLARRALGLDAAYGKGALEILFVSLTMSEPGPEPERIARARRHFERALELSAGTQAAPYVAYAEAVSVPAGNRSEFAALLERALAIDLDAAPGERLANALFQRRARWLRSRTDQLFNQ